MSNVAASRKAKLLEIARQMKVSSYFVLIRYANERLLGRLVYSQWAEQFALKGGMMLPVWNDGDIYRPTADIDLRGPEGFTLDKFQDVIRSLCEMKPHSAGGILPYDDGLDFLVNTIKSKFEQEGGSAGGKIELTVVLAGSPIKMKIDVGFGSPVTPDLVIGEYPSFLQDAKRDPIPAPRISMYPPETTIAEKLHAVVQYGSLNTRIRDYYDLYVILKAFDLDNDVLSTALRRTFEAQERVIPEELPGLSPEYASDKQKVWEQFNENTALRSNLPSFDSIVAYIRERTAEPLSLARQAEGGPTL
jgi:predicted nucleotidyltransferase component of viral defense system